MLELKGLMVGGIYETNNSGEIEILEIVNSRKVLIRFMDTGFEKFTDSRLIRKGIVKDNKQIGTLVILDDETMGLIKYSELEDRNH